LQSDLDLDYRFLPLPSHTYKVLENAVYNLWSGLESEVGAIAYVLQVRVVQRQVLESLDHTHDSVL